MESVTDPWGLEFVVLVRQEGSSPGHDLAAKCETQDENEGLQIPSLHVAKPALTLTCGLPSVPWVVEGSG